ncbi:hemerythrin domain-containing protein [Streptomyces sp. TLI_185]|uniref:hemerythrin domain-containing protein n=1 Tax=Streptomyces sp. TLI_185 TaxID=2485151 RepID=UPI00288B2427|nr:hemerythrin domain-containing protein [Streptomyces sp. TLI_185]
MRLPGTGNHRRTHPGTRQGREADQPGARRPPRRQDRVHGGSRPQDLRRARPHTQVEEHGLFPALAVDFPEKIAALEDEHRRIEAALAEANGPYLADPTWPDRPIETLDLLREHILKEQDGVFPAALALLDAGQWETVEAGRARVGAAMSEPLPLT